MTKRGQATVRLAVIIAVIFILVAGMIPVFVTINTNLQMDRCLDFLSKHGYVAYADNQGILHVEGISISGSPPLTLSDDAESWIEFRPDLDPTKLAVKAKPTIVERGITLGYSLPVGGNDEELFYNICAPNRWNGESDIHVHVYAWLDTTQNEAIDAVKLQLDWAHISGEIVIYHVSVIFRCDKYGNSTYG